MRHRGKEGSGFIFSEIIEELPEKELDILHRLINEQSTPTLHSHNKCMHV
jgi:hypothetical protein